MSSTQYLVEIASWDWPLHVGIRPETPTVEPDLQGDLICADAILIEAIVLAPQEHRGKRTHLTLYPLPREVIAGDRDGREVGSFYRDPAERKDLAFSANLFLPADTLQGVIVCLGSKWRSLHMWVDDGEDRSAVTDFGFAADLQGELSVQ